MSIALILIGSFMMSFENGQVVFGSLICMGIPILVGGLAFIIWGAKKYSGAGRRQLIVSPQGIQISEEGVESESLISLGELQRYYLDQSRQKHEQSAAPRPRTNEERQTIREPAIYFHGAEARELVFNLKGIITQGHLLRLKTPVALDYLEIHWIFLGLQTHLHALAVFEGSQVSPNLVAARSLAPPPARHASPDGELASRRFELDAGLAGLDATPAELGVKTEVEVDVNVGGVEIADAQQDDTDPW